MHVQCSLVSHFTIYLAMIHSFNLNMLWWCFNVGSQTYKEFVGKRCDLSPLYTLLSPSQICYIYSAVHTSQNLHLHRYHYGYTKNGLLHIHVHVLINNGWKTFFPLICEMHCLLCIRAVTMFLVTCSFIPHTHDKFIT